MNFRILRALLKKEVRLMMLNSVVPKIIVIMPIMVMLVAPLIATLDVRNINVVVVDNDRTQISRQIVADIDAADALAVRDVVGTHKQALDEVERGQADVIMTIPYGFSRDLAGLDIEANGTNAMKGMLGSQYVAGSIGETIKAWLKAQGHAIEKENVLIINRYNPTLDYRNYMIPALMVVLLIIICGFLPTLNLVGEKESGTIEAINVTPVGKFTFVLSKLIPFWIAGMFVVTVGMIVGRLVYGLAPAGSLWLIYLAAMLFALFMSGLGVLVANGSSTMLQSIFVMFAVIIIFQLMGGLFTPIGSMPEWAQKLTYAIPPRYFNEIMRAVYLKGSTLGDLSSQFILLGSFAALTALAAALTYRKQS